MGDTLGLFSLAEKTAVVTGGSGALGSEMARGLAEAGARVALLARNRNKLNAAASSLTERGLDVLAVEADVLDAEQLQKARQAILDSYGSIDILVNAAGGNLPGATLQPDADVFGLSEAAFRKVFDLNLIGTVLPTQAFGRTLAAGDSGCIVNISSMAAQKVLTRVVGYSAAKAAVENYTRWMAVELARSFGEKLRVNAIAPGFFVGEQNRDLLMNQDGSLTDRGRLIIDHTPMGRFGHAEELVGTLVWLCSDASRFVTGIVVPVDGGFSAFSGI